VLTVDGQNDQPEPAQPGRMGPAPEAVPAPASMPAIAPPPTIDLGQTKDMVIATCGQPLRIARLGEKEIFYYKDMKVTFINGAVSNVE